MNTRIGGNQGVSRVSEWARGDRGVGESTAWDVGRALRELGANTNEVEALWGAGFFPAILRFLQLTATNVHGDGPATATRLFAVLAARFVQFETDLLSDVESTDHGARYLWAFHQLRSGRTNAHTSTLIRLAGTASYFTRTAAIWLNYFSTFYSAERFAHYEGTWKSVARGDRPSGSTTSIGGWLRGDDDLLDVIFDAANRMADRWIPSLMIVRLWRLASEWIDELYPQEASDMGVIPDIFLPLFLQRQRAAEVDAWEEDSAAQAAYSQWRDRRSR
ncbi:MAG TPA: hypothetical protein VGC72_08550 [Candidatus Elarobacter sp.]